MRLTVALVLTAVIATGCGGSDGFDAEGFIARANEAGANLVLGEELLGTDSDVEVYEVELAESAAPDAAKAGQASPSHAHGGGSLYVTESDEAGVAEYERCESAATLLCFRASNVVLILNDAIPETEIAAVEEAFLSLARGWRMRPREILRERCAFNAWQPRPLPSVPPPAPGHGSDIA